MKASEYTSNKTLQVRPVRTGRDERTFIMLPFEIYRNDQHWASPLLSEEKKRWQAVHNASLAGRPYRRFLAFRGQKAVGRIVASLDPVFRRLWQENTGFFGFFECRKDYDAAEALLDAAERHLSDNGAKISMGPVNLSFQDEVGCLTSGFAEDQQVLTPYNPPYYVDFLEAAGYRECRKYLAFRWTPDSKPNKAMLRANRLFRKGNSGAQVSLRSVVDRDWKNEVRLLFDLYNLSFKDVWGFTPISWPEFLERSQRFRKFYRPEMILIAEVNGAAAGFGVLIPDINAVLKKVNGRIFPWGWVKLLQGVPHLSSGRFLLLGVHPAHTGRGLAAMIAMEMAERGRKLNFTNAELSLIDDRNTRIKKVIMAAGCEEYRTFKLFRKPLL